MTRNAPPSRSRRAPAAGRWMRTAMTCAAIPWAADGEPADLAATRPHIERYRLFASGLNAVILAEFAVDQSVAS